MRKRWMIAGAVSALMTGGAFAQERHDMVFTQALPAPPPGVAAGGDVMYATQGMAVGGGIGGTVQFLSTEMSFEGAVVKGAPYSAEAVTETTQVLSDGNRITRKTSASLYRDSEGRTRREHSLPAIGPWATSGTPPVNIFINDPVSGVNYILDSNSKTARKVGVANFTRATSAMKAGLSTRMSAVQGIQSSGVQSGLSFERTEAVRVAAPQSKEEKLPSQLIEGVQAEGTRTTVTIPVGEVGNERPIDIVSERWYSPELKTVVMSKNKDPRMGETVYTLKGLQRAEPSRSLFEVPADYTIADDSSADMIKHKLLMEKMVIEHKQE